MLSGLRAVSALADLTVPQAMTRHSLVLSDTRRRAGDVDANRNPLRRVRHAYHWSGHHLGILVAAVVGLYRRRKAITSPARREEIRHILKTEGFFQLVRRLAHKDTYAGWIDQFDTLRDTDVVLIGRAVASWTDPPLISVVMPTYNSHPGFLEAALESITKQLYVNWELVVVDDASTDASPRRIAAAFAARDHRVRTVELPDNGGIAVATNAGIEAARGEYVAFMDHDDLLPPHALYLVAEKVRTHPGARLLYTDHDHVDEAGWRSNPYFKPDYNPDLLLGQNYINHLTVIEAGVLRAVGSLDPALDGAQDHDLVLRVVSVVPREAICHIPFVGYHWRVFSSPRTFSASRADEAAASARTAIARHVGRCGLRATVEPAPKVPRWYRVRWELPTPAPAVTAVVPTRNGGELLERAVDGLLNRTSYPELRVLIADNDTDDPSTLAYLRMIGQDPRVVVLPAPGPFNYSAINNAAVAATDTPLVLLLNDDVIVEQDDWLIEMASNLVRPDVGIVGAKLVYPDEFIQHAGVVLGLGGVAGHSHKWWPRDHPGHHGRLALAQDVSAVTGACLLTKRAIWEEVGGLDAEGLAVAFNDVDFCLRVRARGHRIVWTPHAELYHHESASRGYEDTPEKLQRFEREKATLLARWGDVLECDPNYSPNLTIRREDFTRAYPPRVVKPWL